MGNTLAKFGKTLAYSGILWHTLAYSGILWHTLAYSGILWHTLAYSDILWHSLAYSGTYSGILWHNLANSGIIWHTLAYSDFHCIISASLITDDGAYHCPVGSIWPFFYIYCHPFGHTRAQFCQGIMINRSGNY